MKKKIIALSIAFILVAIAAIGTTLAYLTDNAGSVLNNFTVGNLDINAVEKVNHTNGAGADKDGNDGVQTIALTNVDDGATHSYSGILPGDNLEKTVEIQNLANSNAAIFAVKVTENFTDDSILTSGAWATPEQNIVDTIPAPGTTNIELLGVVSNGAGERVFYYYMPTGANQELDLSLVVPTEINNTTNLAKYNGEIGVYVAAIQADGFATTTEAITELEATVSGVKLAAQTPEQGE